MGTDKKKKKLRWWQIVLIVLAVLVLLVAILYKTGVLRNIVISASRSSEAATIEKKQAGRELWDVCRRTR